jgi:hypothetical protein
VEADVAKSSELGLFSALKSTNRQKTSRSRVFGQTNAQSRISMRRDQIVIPSAALIGGQKSAD